MQITIFGVGTRGDTQPLVALGVGLKASGHEIRFATHDDFRPMIEAYGFEFFRLPGKSAGFFGGPAGIALRDRSRRSPREFQEFFEDFMGAYSDRLLKASWEAAQGADALVSWSWTRTAQTLAEKLDIPSFVAAVTPVSYLPTGDFPNPFQGEFDPHRGPEYNRSTWDEALPFFAVGMRQLKNWREKLGLPALDAEVELDRFRQLPHLFGISRHVLPMPDDWSKTSATIAMTGYWFLDHPDGYEPSQDLSAFLEGGEPPVVVGFGSQVAKSPRKLTDLVVKALEHAGKRAILVTGFGGLESKDLPPNILKISSCPYDWLFARAAGVVHQGGSGSTSAGVRAGIPGFAVPFGWEQALWGHRLHQLGVGPEPIPAERLTAQNLAGAIVQLTEAESMRAASKRLGEAVRAEDGVGTAVELIHRFLEGGDFGGAEYK